MNKLLLLAFFPMSLFCEIDESKLIKDLQNNIDEISYEITHFSNSESEYFYMTGYFNALNDFYVKIDSGYYDKHDFPQMPETPKGVNGIEQPKENK